MKTSLLTLGLFSICQVALAVDWTLTDGRVLREASVLSQTPRTVVIQHADGLSGVAKTLLPAELAVRYPIDEAAARESERQAAEARARADAFHKAEAERAALVRIEREQTALHNAQLAALEASERLAEAEAARIANQRTEIVYEYVSFGRSPCYARTSSPTRDCAPRWNKKIHDRFDRHDHHARTDRNSETDRLGLRQRGQSDAIRPTQAFQRAHSQSHSTRPSATTSAANRQKPPAKIRASVAAIR